VEGAAALDLAAEIERLEAHDAVAARPHAGGASAGAPTVRGDGARDPVVADEVAVASAADFAKLGERAVAARGRYRVTGIAGAALRIAALVDDIVGGVEPVELGAAQPVLGGGGEGGRSHRTEPVGVLSRRRPRRNCERQHEPPSQTAHHACSSSIHAGDCTCARRD